MNQLNSKFQKKALLTGATGFIGNRLKIWLEIQNYEVVCLVRENNYPTKNIKLDLEKERIPIKFLRDFDVVFHLASYCHDKITESPKEIKRYEDLNTYAVENLAKDCASGGVGEFIFLSTSKVRETNLVNKKSIYSITKRKAEKKLKKISTTEDIKITIIRSSLVYGPGQKGNLMILEKMMNKWWVPVLGITKNKKKMIHVDDLVRAIVFVHENHQSNFNLLNINDGKNYSTEEICKIIKNKKPFLFNWKINEIFLKYLLPFDKLIGYKLNKLFSNDLECSENSKVSGFKPNLSFEDFDKNDF